LSANRNTTKVFVCAEASDELARLEEMVRAAPSLALVGSNLGRAGLDDEIALIEPDVLLAHVVFDEATDQHWPEAGEQIVKAVLLVSEPGFAEALAAMRADESGIRGVLPDFASDAEIEAAIGAVAAGLLVVHPDVAGYAPPDATPRAPDSSIQPLSPRESEVLNLLAAGLANKEVAWQLKISEHTVKFHITSIFNKLNASTRAEAVAIGARQGLIIL
jgi:NarL family two-component system response regulator YdfI